MIFVVYSLFLERIIIHENFSIDKLVLLVQTIFATGHLRHVVTAIDKYLAIRANAYESMEERSNDIKHKSAVLVDFMFHGLTMLLLKFVFYPANLLIQEKSL